MRWVVVKDVPLNTIYTKYILRMFVSFIFWSAIYTSFNEGNLYVKIAGFFAGHYHLWFIPMIIGLYMCIPFIKPITENDTKTKYFLALAFIFAFCIPETKILTHDFGNELLVSGVNTIISTLDNMNMHMVLGYASYFVLGYYINKIILNKKHRLMIYILGILGFAATIGLTLIISLKTQNCCSSYYGKFTVNVLFEALAVFTWFKYRKYDNFQLSKFIQKLSKYCFGIFLIHAIVLEQLDAQLGLNPLSFNPIFSVLCISCVVFVISSAISALLNRIPIIKKYIV